jgi:hypothetical protein
LETLRSFRASSVFNIARKINKGRQPAQASQSRLRR